MATEVELKAWVDDPAAVERRLREMSSFVTDFVKEDVYYLPPGDEKLDPDRERSDRDRRDFRIRIEDGTATVTFKTKSREGGMEVNNEREFTVSDADRFRELMQRIGCRPYARKRKQGKRFTRDGIVLELCEVTRLGWFLEIEKMVDLPGEGEDEAVRNARSEVRRLFDLAGIPAARIESRNYTDLLRERGIGAP